MTPKQKAIATLVVTGVLLVLKAALDQNLMPEDVRNYVDTAQAVATALGLYKVWGMQPPAPPAE
jgi:hypothetical protein